MFGSCIFSTINAKINMEKAYGEYVWTRVRFPAAPPSEKNGQSSKIDHFYFLSGCIIQELLDRIGDGSLVCLFRLRCLLNLLVRIFVEAIVALCCSCGRAMALVVSYGAGLCTNHSYIFESKI